jgi:DNA-binding NarL/FixJ family response regulator
MKTRVLLLAQHDTDQLLTQAVEAGAHGYLLKSDTARELVCAVEALGNGGSFFTARVARDVLEGYFDILKLAERGRHKELRRLTGREREVVQLLAEGRSNKEVGVALNISVKTAETHRANIMHKIDSHSVADLVRYAIRNHIIEA